LSNFVQWEKPGPSIERDEVIPITAPTSDAQTRTEGWATRRVNDCNGFLFVSQVGNVYPSGFLRIHAGNIRETPLQNIYRNSAIFKSLPDSSKLEGKCGACEYKEICGGSRARAYAVTDDPLAQEPCCIYQPRNWDPKPENEASACANAASRSHQIVS
jgi:radical SAM protein with 4Fe4S-binding SPASM domain